MGLFGQGEPMSLQRNPSTVVNLADPDLELVDPTPNVHSLFVQFDRMFFWSKLHPKTIVRWSKRMYSCAGVCSYNGRLCNIALSEPLLKLRPRKDLVETLLHEMIHAYLFITNADCPNDRDGHGPDFQSHMHRINKYAGLNISIYHDFQDEVEVYQTHWWRCNGVCQNRTPYFGLVRRSMNRAPGPSDFWWKQHQATCRGQFIKIKEPQKKKKPATNPAKAKNSLSNVTKPVGNPTNRKSVNDLTSQPFVNVTAADQSRVVTPKVFTGQGRTTSGSTPSSPASQGVTTTIINVWEDVATTVRNIWANKSVNGQSGAPVKRKANDQKNSPPAKTRRIDDYFPAASAILKDLYGDDIEVAKINNRIVVDGTKQTKPADLVDCPVCKSQVNSRDINRHLDECLNNGLIEQLSKESIQKQESIIKVEPGTSRSSEISAPKCPCCGKTVDKSMDEHLEECLSFFANNTTIPEEGASTSSVDIIVIADDDDIFDESLTLNETGTKYPCPCCMIMIESEEMNAHLDVCLT